MGDVNKKGRKSCTPESDPERGKKRGYYPQQAAACRTAGGVMHACCCNAVPRAPQTGVAHGVGAGSVVGAAWVETRPAGGIGAESRRGGEEQGRHGR